MNDDYDQFFRATYPRLVAMGVAMSISRAEAQELAQETMLRAHRRWETVAAYDAPGAWCRRVMANLLIDRHRSARAERSALEHLGDHAERAVDGDPQVRADLPAWADLVGSLTDRQRLAVTLYYGEDLSVGEVADVMAISTGTVKSALAKARRNVERTLRRGDGTGGDGRLPGREVGAPTRRFERRRHLADRMLRLLLEPTGAVEGSRP